nr:MAG TPA: hypothetical protein [Caudoviricetes sp.]
MTKTSHVLVKIPIERRYNHGQKSACCPCQKWWLERERCWQFKSNCSYFYKE